MSEPGHIQVVDDGIRSVSKEGNRVYAVRQRSLGSDDVADRGIEELDDRDIRKKQVRLTLSPRTSLYTDRVRGLRR